MILVTLSTIGVVQTSRGDTIAAMTNSGQSFAPNSLERFVVRQRITMMVNRYEIRANDKEGPVLAIAQQKRMAMKEKVTFFADEERTQPVFGFQARQVMDLAATYDITDAAGQPIGLFQKDFKASMLRSTWLFESPAQQLQGRGQERSQAIAILRRFADFSWPIHFDFATSDGTTALSVVRGWSLRDSYDCELPALPNGDRLDWRIGASLAVACDALMAR